VPPAEIEATPEVRPATFTGVRLLVVVPSPSCPAELLPQHLTPPEVVSAHVWLSPASIWRASKAQLSGPVKTPVASSKVTSSGSEPSMEKLREPEPPETVGSTVCPGRAVEKIAGEL
jgi:hypothetical protein